MSFSDLAVPERDGEALFIPPILKYGEALGLNRSSGLPGAAIAGEAAAVADEARKSAVASAIEYTAALGLDAGSKIDPAGPVIASGHQPVMFHPGVALKTMAIKWAAEDAGATALFISVDSDEFRGEKVFVPTVRGGRLTRTDVLLFPQRAAATFETAELETAHRVRLRLDDVFALLNHEKLANPREAMEQFLDRLDGYDLDMPTLTGRSIVMRRAWESPAVDGLLELPVSVLSRTKPFLAFAEDIIKRINDFARIYNGELARYRAERKLRYPANPFPDLELGDGRVETPFWALTGPTRERLYARVEDGEVFLSAGSADDMPLGLLGASGIEIRPKAIALSMYLRLFVCDLFVHGVGGSKYDTITDSIIERFYGITPPRRACVSGTLWPGIAVEDPRGEIEKIRKTLRDIEQHPEKWGSGFDGRMAALANEKAALVAEIRKPGADRKTIGARIAGLNRKMAELIEPLRLKKSEELEDLLEREKEREVAQARDYPFFLYKPERVLSLLR